MVKDAREILKNANMPSFSIIENPNEIFNKNSYLQKISEVTEFSNGYNPMTDKQKNDLAKEILENDRRYIALSALGRDDAYYTHENVKTTRVRPETFSFNAQGTVNINAATKDKNSVQDAANTNATTKDNEKGIFERLSEFFESPLNIFESPLDKQENAQEKALTNRDKEIINDLIAGKNLSEASVKKEELSKNVLRVATELDPLSTVQYLKKNAPEKITKEYAYQLSYQIVTGLNRNNPEQYDHRAIRRELPKEFRQTFETGLANATNNYEYNIVDKQERFVEEKNKKAAKTVVETKHATRPDKPMVSVSQTSSQKTIQQNVGNGITSKTPENAAQKSQQKIINVSEQKINKSEDLDMLLHTGNCIM